MAKGMSLHVGLNSVDPAHYGGWSGPLAACEADAEDMRALATKAGFAATLLETAAATREAVIDGIRSAAEGLAAGDIFFLTYSGHGGQVPDKDGDEPDDLKDETWCLYDGQLIDDELYRLWTGFAAGVRLLVLSDSCHSGTVTKLAFANSGAAPAVQPVYKALGIENGRYRFMPDDVALRTYRLNRAFYDTLGTQNGGGGKKKDVQATVRLISGCQDNQLSSDGTFNGLFTGMLLRVWDDGHFEGDYARFHEAIVKRMPPVQTPRHFLVGAANTAFDTQRPFMI